MSSVDEFQCDNKDGFLRLTDVTDYWNSLIWFFVRSFVQCMILKWVVCGVTYHHNFGSIPKEGDKRARAYHHWLHDKTWTGGQYTKWFRRLVFCMVCLWFTNERMTKSLHQNRLYVEKYNTQREKCCNDLPVCHNKFFNAAAKEVGSMLKVILMGGLRRKQQRVLFYSSDAMSWISLCMEWCIEIFAVLLTTCAFIQNVVDWGTKLLSGKLTLQDTDALKASLRDVRAELAQLQATQKANGDPYGIEDYMDSKLTLRQPGDQDTASSGQAASNHTEKPLASSQPGKVNASDKDKVKSKMCKVCGVSIENKKTYCSDKCQKDQQKTNRTQKANEHAAQASAPPGKRPREGDAEDTGPPSKKSDNTPRMEES